MDTPQQRHQAPNGPLWIAWWHGLITSGSLPNNSKRSICNGEGKGAAAMTVSSCRLVCDARN
eukprot:5465588-Pleurochrysis_carterae.AAC.1